MPTFGVRLQTARKAARKTQGAVADALGVTVQAVSQWENDRTMPTGSKLFDLMDLLGLPLDTGLSIRELAVSELAADIGNTRSWSVAQEVEWRGPEAWSQLDDEESASSLGNTPRYEVHWQPVGEIYALKLHKSHSDELGAPFRPGDLIIFDTGRAPESGDVVIVQLGKGPAFSGVYRPRGKDEHRAPIIDIELATPIHFHGRQGKVLRIDASTPGQILGVVREHRRFFRTS